MSYMYTARSAVTRALIGGGGVYSCICVMPDEFLLKSFGFKVHLNQSHMFCPSLLLRLTLTIYLFIYLFTL